MTDAAEPLDAEGGGLPDPNPAAAGGACWEHDWGGRSTQTRPSSAAPSRAGGPPGALIGAPAQSEWLKVTPWGLRNILGWLAARYGDAAPPLVITENGIDAVGDDRPLPDALDDDERVAYLAAHVQAVAEAVALDGVDVRGYYTWSFMDNFEWADGYSKRFGLHHVDYASGARSARAPLASRSARAPRARRTPFGPSGRGS